MNYKITLVFILFFVGCSNISDESKQELLNNIEEEIFDVEFEYKGYQEESVLRGRLKNTLNCTIRSLTFEIYLHKAERDSSVPDLEKGKPATTEDILKRYKPGKVLDQETVGVSRMVEPGETKSFVRKQLSSMRVEKFYLTQLTLTDFSTYSSYSSCFEAN